MARLEREHLLELTDALDAELSKQTVNLGRVRQLSRAISAATERNACLLKQIQDIARYGQPSIRTERWSTALEMETARSVNGSERQETIEIGAV